MASIIVSLIRGFIRAATLPNALKTRPEFWILALTHTLPLGVKKCRWCPVGHEAEASSEISPP